MAAGIGGGVVSRRAGVGVGSALSVVRLRLSQAGPRPRPIPAHVLKELNRLGLVLIGEPAPRASHRDRLLKISVHCGHCLQDWERSTPWSSARCALWLVG